MSQPGYRVRVRRNMSTSKYKYQDYDHTGTYPPTYFESGKDCEGHHDEIGDWNTPNFRKVQSGGGIVMSPMHLEKRSRSLDKRVFTLDTGSIWGSRVFTGTMLADWAFSPSIPSWYATRIADSKLSTITDAHSKVASEDFMALVSVAEARKTASTIARPFGAAQDLINKILRRARVLSKAKASLDFGLAVASSWNEYRFGWKPLLYDIDGIMSAYVQSEAWSAKPERKTARASNEVIWKDVQTNSTTAPGLSVLSMVGNFSHEAKISSGVLYELRDESLVDATKRRMGLRLSDVPASLWELVPWSFVVDRFVTVGSWLNAITPKPGVTILGSWTTVTEHNQRDYTCVEAAVKPWVGDHFAYGGDSGGLYSEVDSIVQRYTNPGLPIAPSWNPKGLNLEQQVDHCALIGQAIGNLFRNPGQYRSKNPF